jgi:hypothetical protein
MSHTPNILEAATGRRGRFAARLIVGLTLLVLALKLIEATEPLWQRWRSGGQPASVRSEPLSRSPS